MNSNYYEEILSKIEYCMRDEFRSNKDKLERLKDILDVSSNLYETGKLNTAQYNTIFHTISEKMWECL